MSCGNPHETDCQEVLERVYQYLDGEIDHELHHKIATHLTECAPCLSEFEIEQVVKALVRRSCGSMSCSDDVKGRIMTRINAARLAGKAQPSKS